MSLVIKVIGTIIAILMIVSGVYMIYLSVRKPRFGEGYTLRALKNSKASADDK